jgi:hypothetical protein
MKLTVDVNKILQKIEKSTEHTLEELTEYLLNYANNNHIYKNRTGNLTSLTDVTSVGNMLSIYNTSDYATFVHDAPFEDNWLERTLKDNDDYIKEQLIKGITNEFLH